MNRMWIQAAIVLATVGLACAPSQPIDPSTARGEAAPHAPEFSAWHDSYPESRIWSRYPESARRDSIEGHVTLQFRIDASGEVVDAEVLEGVPPGVFDEAALATIRGLRYPPLAERQAPYPDPVRVRLPFQLE